MNEVVPRISEYANSQNKVSAADFFSNHPFHVRIEEASRRIWAPAREGTHLQTRWFYERARGQYVNAVAYLTPAKKREFELHHPRKQLIQKTDLAKAVMSFRGLPHVVSSGAQKNFAKFADYVAEMWNTNSDDFGEAWFRNAVSMTIVFRTLEKLVQNADWYAQGYRANIVTYTIGLAQHALAEGKASLDLERIWQKQAVSAPVENWMMAVARQVQERIVDAAGVYGISNVTEWCKREPCWSDLKTHIRLVVPKEAGADILNREEQSDQRRSARKEQRVLNGVEAQMAVVSKGHVHWGKLLEWSNEGTLMTPTDMDLLRLASAPRSVPSPAQAERILKAERKALDEGYKP